MPEIPVAVGRRFVKINEAAAYIDVAAHTIRDWIRAGRLTGYKFGPSTLRVDLNELDALGGAR